MDFRRVHKVISWKYIFFLSMNTHAFFVRKRPSEKGHESDRFQLQEVPTSELDKDGGRENRNITKKSFFPYLREMTDVAKDRRFAKKRARRVIGFAAIALFFLIATFGGPRSSLSSAGAKSRSLEGVASASSYKLYGHGEGNGICPEGTSISKAECYAAAFTIGKASGMSFANTDLNVGTWSEHAGTWTLTPCGCFIYDDSWIDYKDPSEGHCRSTALTQLVCNGEETEESTEEVDGDESSGAPETEPAAGSSGASPGGPGGQHASFGETLGAGASAAASETMVVGGIMAASVSAAAVYTYQQQNARSDPDDTDQSGQTGKKPPPPGPDSSRDTGGGAKSPSKDESEDPPPPEVLRIVSGTGKPKKNVNKLSMMLNFAIENFNEADWGVDSTKRLDEHNPWWDHHMEFFAYKTYQPGTIRIVVGRSKKKLKCSTVMIPQGLLKNYVAEAWGPTSTKKMDMNNYWDHKFEFFAYPTQQPGSIRIAVGRDEGPGRIMFNHPNFDQSVWDMPEVTMDLGSFKHVFEFWVFPTKEMGSSRQMGTPHPTEGTPHPTEGTLHPTEGIPHPTEGTPHPTEGTPHPTE